MQVKLGFSTGALYKTDLDLVSKVEAIRAIGCQAIELSFLRPGEFNETEVRKLLVYGSRYLKHFNFVSLHAPEYGYRFDDTTRRIFELIDWLNNEGRRLDLVVFHPHTVVNFDVFHLPAFKIAFENMDYRKVLYGKVSDMKTVLDKKESFAMVLDVMHAYSNDPMLKLVADFYQRLGRRIAAVHLSGYADGHHAPLFQTGQLKIIRSVQDLKIPQSFGAPIIVESILATDELERERDYILQAINGIG
jgi:hypothetical protein